MDKQKFYNDLCEEEARLLAEINALKEILEPIQVLKGKYKTDRPMSTQTSLYEPQAINNKVSDVTKAYLDRTIKRRTGRVAKKVLEALELIGDGTAHRVGEVLFELYPNEFTLSQAKTAAKFQLSKLKSEGKVKGAKIEGKNNFNYEYIKIEKAA